MNRESLLRSRLIEIKDSIKNTKLIAVTKYYPMEDIIFLYKAGHRDFGESRVKELLEKSNNANARGMSDIVWHFIGNLQSNKINQLLQVNNLKFIHSINSLKLLEELVKKDNQFVGNKLSFFLQVNTSLEEEKSGFESEEELTNAIRYFLDYSPVKYQLKGLMTMGKFRTDDLEGDARICFQKLRKIKGQMEKIFSGLFLELSMGMSQDYKIAITEQSNFIRVGSALLS